MKEVSRNAFTRESILRETVRVTQGETCQWCGCVDRRHLFAYYSQLELDDGSHTEPERLFDLFCSIGCMKTHRQCEKRRGATR
jgi:hypothetical protein